MAKNTSFISRILGRLQLRSEGEAPSTTQEERVVTTPKAVEDSKITAKKISYLSGAGNTFLIEIIESAEQALAPEQVIKTCQHYACDGYLALERKNPKHYQWHFLNRDGSRAEFCGNAARCAQLYLQDTQGETEVLHSTLAGEIKTWTEAERHWVQMPKPKVLSEKISIVVENQSFMGFWCDTGVPHFVTPQRNYRYDFWKQISQKLRFAPEFADKGANITWVSQPTRGRTIQAVTYERGVEDFTQACGTGAMAAALYMKTKSPQEENFEVRMPGGTLSIRETKDGWIMTGPVEKRADVVRDL